MGENHEKESIMKNWKDSRLTISDLESEKGAG